MAYKTYVCSLELNQIDWIKKTTKGFKLRSTSELARIIFDFVMKYSTAELKETLTKQRVQADLEEATQKFTEWSKRKEELEAQLETSASN